MGGRRKTPEDYRALAKERGHKWSGPEVPNTKTNTWWGCPRGHKWEATYNSIHKGTGCPHCAGNARKLPEDYHALAEECEFEWLGPEISNTATKTEWKCLRGHQWEATYNSIWAGNRCPHCSRKTAEDYHALAEERSFKWLGPFPKTTKYKSLWECPDGHQWETTYAVIRQGHGCPHCNRGSGGLVPKTPEDYHALAESRGFKWLGPEAPNIATKTKWECGFGHQWEAIYGNINQGTGCPECARKARRKTEEDYHAVAKSRGFEWLGPLQKSIHSKTWWKCSEGHKWEAAYSTVYHQGNGCLHCSGLMRKTPKDYHALATKRGFRWLGSEVYSIKTKTEWECEKGHVWEAIYNHIQQGNGCPHCLDLVNGQRVSRRQRQLCAMVLGAVLNHPVGRKRVDVALLDEKIAIEYDCWFWHGHKQEEDVLRDEELLTAGWKILHIRSNEKLPIQNQLDAALMQLRNGDVFVEIVLDDWGKSSTFADIRAMPKIPLEHMQKVCRQLPLWEIA